MFRTHSTRGIIPPVFAVLATFAITCGNGAYAQRQRFPAPMTVNVAPPASAPASAPATFSPAPYGAGSYSPSPYTQPPGQSSYGAPSYGAPSYGASMGPGSVPVTGGSVLGPTTSPALSGGVQLPPPQWDPYAPPGSIQQPMLLPQDPYFPGSPNDTVVKMRRLIQDVRLDYTFLSATGTKKFSTNDLGLNVTVAIPFLYNQDSPLLVTPGFAVHWWQGGYPQQQYALPPRVYDAYLSAAWNPQVTPWLGGELEFCVGVYSDFVKKVTTESLRYTGRGLFVLGFSPTMKIKAGVIYYDRVKIKIMPAGGLIWTPSADTRFDIFFPEPRFAKRLTVVGNTEWWFYVRGEYGGGSWSFAWTEFAPPNEPVYQADYNDIRIAMGLEFARLNILDGHIEFGVAVNREIIPNGPIPEYKPSTTFFLGAGLAY